MHYTGIAVKEVLSLKAILLKLYAPHTIFLSPAGFLLIKF